MTEETKPAAVEPWAANPTADDYARLREMVPEIIVNNGMFTMFAGSIYIARDLPTRRILEAQLGLPSPEIDESISLEEREAGFRENEAVNMATFDHWAECARHIVSDAKKLEEFFGVAADAGPPADVPPQIGVPINVAALLHVVFCLEIDSEASALYAGARPGNRAVTIKPPWRFDPLPDLEAKGGELFEGDVRRATIYVDDPRHGTCVTIHF